MPQYCGARITELQKSTYSSYANLNLQSGEEAINFVHQYIRDCVDSSNPDWAGIEGHIYLVEVKTRSISVEYCTGVSSIAFPLLCHNHQSTFGIPLSLLRPGSIPLFRSTLRSMVPLGTSDYEGAGFDPVLLRPWALRTPFERC